MEKKSKIYVAGHNGLVGSAIIRTLKENGYENVITRTRRELDLMDYESVLNFFKREQPEYVFLAAAKVGGIMANKMYPAEFINENLGIKRNIIHSSHLTDVKKLLFLGSSCIYPREAPQPIKEEYFMSGKLESTNDAYAIAKIAGIMMCQAYNRQYGRNYISLMPTNLYGPNDNFDLENSHVLPALIRKFHEAKERGDSSITMWGTGSALREFLHVDDLADATLFLMNNYHEPDIINVGTGSDVSIRELAETIRKIVGFNGTLTWDSSKPDGTPRKLLDVSKLHSLGWRHSIPLLDGLRDTYTWYLDADQKKM